MATITRVQHVQYDEVTLLAVQGKGTTYFMLSNAPDDYTVSNIGAVFTGRLRITRLANGKGYNFLVVDAPRYSDRKRVHFKADAQVRIGERVLTVEQYYNFLAFAESVGI